MDKEEFPNQPLEENLNTESQESQEDPLLVAARELKEEIGVKFSPQAIQQKFKIGFNRAEALFDALNLTAFSDESFEQKSVVDIKPEVKKKEIHNPYERFSDASMKLVEECGEMALARFTDEDRELYGAQFDLKDVEEVEGLLRLEKTDSRWTHERVIETLIHRMEEQMHSLLEKDIKNPITSQRKLAKEASKIGSAEGNPANGPEEKKQGPEALSGEKAREITARLIEEVFGPDEEAVNAFKRQSRNTWLKLVPTEKSPRPWSPKTLRDYLVRWKEDYVFFRKWRDSEQTRTEGAIEPLEEADSSLDKGLEAERSSREAAISSGAQSEEDEKKNESQQNTAASSPEAASSPAAPAPEPDAATIEIPEQEPAEGPMKEGERDEWDKEIPMHFPPLTAQQAEQAEREIYAYFFPVKEDLNKFIKWKYGDWGSEFAVEIQKMSRENPTWSEDIIIKKAIELFKKRKEAFEKMQEKQKKRSSQDRNLPASGLKSKTGEIANPLASNVSPKEKASVPETASQKEQKENAPAQPFMPLEKLKREAARLSLSPEDEPDNEKAKKTAIDARLAWIESEMRSHPNKDFWETVGSIKNGDAEREGKLASIVKEAQQRDLDAQKNRETAALIPEEFQQDGYSEAKEECDPIYKFLKNDCGLTDEQIDGIEYRTAVEYAKGADGAEEVQAIEVYNLHDVLAARYGTLDGDRERLDSQLMQEKNEVGAIIETWTGIAVFVSDYVREFLAKEENKELGKKYNELVLKIKEDQIADEYAKKALAGEAKPNARAGRDHDEPLLNPRPMQGMPPQLDPKPEPAPEPTTSPEGAPAHAETIPTIEELRARFKELTAQKNSNLKAWDEERQKIPKDVEKIAELNREYTIINTEWYKVRNAIFDILDNGELRALREEQVRLDNIDETDPEKKRELKKQKAEIWHKIDALQQKMLSDNYESGSVPAVPIAEASPMPAPEPPPPPLEHYEVPKAVADILKNKFNIPPEKLGEIENFDTLTEGQQRIVLENLAQITLGRIKDQSSADYKKQVEDAKILGFKRLGRLWQGISKNYQIAKLEKVNSENYFGGGMEAHGEILKLLVKGTQSLGLDAHMENGELCVDYLAAKDLVMPGSDRLSPEDAEKVARFNEAALRFSRMPEEWNLEAASRFVGRKKQYHDAEKAFKDSRNEIIALCRKMNGNNAEKAALFANEIERKVTVNQIFNSHPDVEKALDDIQDKSMWDKVINGTIKERGLAFGVGTASRTLSYGALAAISAPLSVVVGAGVAGGVRGRMSAKENLREREHNARMGDLGIREERKAILRRIDDIRNEIEKLKARQVSLSGLDLETNNNRIGNLEIEINGLHSKRLEKGRLEGGFVPARQLIERIKRLEAEIDDPKTEAQKKARLLNQLKLRLEYTKQKIADKEVGYGAAADGSQAATRLGEQLNMAQALNDGESFLITRGINNAGDVAISVTKYIDPEKVKPGEVVIPEVVNLNTQKIRELVPAFMAMEDKLGTQAQKEYINKEMLKAAGISAAFGAVGRTLAWIHRVGFSGAGHEIADDVNSLFHRTSESTHELVNQAKEYLPVSQNVPKPSAPAPAPIQPPAPKGMPPPPIPAHPEAPQGGSRWESIKAFFRREPQGNRAINLQGQRSPFPIKEPDVIPSSKNISEVMRDVMGPSREHWSGEGVVEHAQRLDNLKELTNPNDGVFTPEMHTALKELHDIADNFEAGTPAQQAEILKHVAGVEEKLKYNEEHYNLLRRYNDDINGHVEPHLGDTGTVYLEEARKEIERMRGMYHGGPSVAEAAHAEAVRPEDVAPVHEATPTAPTLPAETVPQNSPLETHSQIIEQNPPAPHDHAPASPAGVEHTTTAAVAPAALEHVPVAPGIADILEGNHSFHQSLAIEQSLKGDPRDWPFESIDSNLRDISADFREQSLLAQDEVMKHLSRLESALKYKIPLVQNQEESGHVAEIQIFLRQMEAFHKRTHDEFFAEMNDRGFRKAAYETHFGPTTRVSEVIDAYKHPRTRDGKPLDFITWLVEGKYKLESAPDKSMPIDIYLREHYTLPVTKQGIVGAVRQAIRR